MNYWVVYDIKTDRLLDLSEKIPVLNEHMGAVKVEGDLPSETQFRREYYIKNGSLVSKRLYESEDYKLLDGKLVEKTADEKAQSDTRIKWENYHITVRNKIKAIDPDKITLKELAQIVKDRG